MAVSGCKGMTRMGMGLAEIFPKSFCMGFYLMLPVALALLRMAGFRTVTTVWTDTPGGCQVLGDSRAYPVQNPQCPAAFAVCFDADPVVVYS